MIKKSILSLFFLLSVVLLSGCELLKNDINLFAETYTNMSQARNFGMKLTLDIEINNQEIVDETTTILYDFESDTVGKLEMNYMEMPMVFDINGNSMTSYFKIASAWYKLDMSAEDLGVDTSIESDDYSFLTDEDVEYTLIEETDTYNVYEFKLTNTAFLTNSIEGLEDQLYELLNVTETEFSELIKTIKLVVTIDKENKFITKLALDLTDMLNDALTPVQEEPTTTTATTTVETTTADTTVTASTPMNDGTTSEPVVVEVNRFVIMIEFNNFNGVNIEITEEMKNAQTFNIFN